jgi:hypothetical protein
MPSGGAAARRLHIEFQSGQLHENRISAGAGNKPVFHRQMLSMTPLEKRPCRSSTSESIAPAKSVQIEVHLAFGTVDTFTATF